MLRLPSVVVFVLLGSSQVTVAADWKADPPKEVSDWRPFADALKMGDGIARVTFADNFGPYAVVARQPKADRVMIDLRTGKEAARLPNADTASAEYPDIPSPDGKYAVRSLDRLRNELEVTTASDGAVRTLKLPHDCEDYAWLDVQRVLVADNRGLMIVDAATATAGKPMAYPAFPDRSYRHGKFLAVSPGGRYAAFATYRGVALLDTETSKFEIAYTLPEFDPRDPKPRVMPALAFSADGTQFACLTGAGNGDGTLRIWVAGGELRTAAVVRKTTPPFSAKSLQAIRGGGWLVDNENLLDAAGESVRIVPAFSTDNGSRLALDTETLLAFGSPILGGKPELGVSRGKGVRVKPLLIGDYRSAAAKPVNSEPFLGSFEPAPPAATLKPALCNPDDPRSSRCTSPARAGGASSSGTSPALRGPR